MVFFSYFLLFLIISPYVTFNYYKLLLGILCYFWLFQVISPYAIIGYSKLYYHMLFVAIVLMHIYSIGGYSINDY
jgi:hypothetical protein